MKKLFRARKLLVQNTRTDKPEIKFLRLFLSFKEIKDG